MIAMISSESSPFSNFRGALKGKRRLRLQRQAVISGDISAMAARTSLQSWNAHLAHGHTWRLRRRLYADLAFAADLP